MQYLGSSEWLVTADNVDYKFNEENLKELMVQYIEICKRQDTSDALKELYTLAFEACRDYYIKEQGVTNV